MNNNCTIIRYHEDKNENNLLTWLRAMCIDRVVDHEMREFVRCRVIIIIMIIII